MNGTGNRLRLYGARMMTCVCDHFGSDVPMRRASHHTSHHTHHTQAHALHCIAARTWPATMQRWKQSRRKNMFDDIIDEKMWLGPSFDRSAWETGKAKKCILFVSVLFWVWCDPSMWPYVPQTTLRCSSVFVVCFFFPGHCLAFA